MASKAEPGLAPGRDRRSNAGARMSRLLENEDDDDFYKTTYGGFEEEEEDNDYQTEDSGSDVTDSDIDIDENDEVKSDGEEDGEGKRKRRLVTKAYKEPKKVSADAVPIAPRPKVEKIKTIEKVPLVIETTIVKSSLRKSTAEKSRSTEDYVREREARSALMKQIADKKRVSDVRRLTQEELLAEAKITEKINLRSLETYQKLELEKKKSRVHRQTYAGPIIRYHSVTVPIGNEPAPETLEINVDTDTSDACEPPSKQPRTTPTEKCSRTFITFSDENVLRRYFPQRRPPRPGYRSTCPVTGLPAKYFDPLTQLPYANSQAFKIIRQTYEQQLAADGETADSVEMSRPRLRHTQTV